MNQNNPPNQAGQSDPNNPYAQDQTQAPSSYGYQQASTAPDLDANAPTLKANELQRLNRKALIFLAGIIGLLLVMAVVLFSKATAPEDTVVKQREEAVFIPELPTEREVIQPAEPIQLAEPITIPPPQLPPPPDSYATAPGAAQQEVFMPVGPTLAQRRMGVDPSAPAAMDPLMQALIAQASGGQASAAGQSGGQSESDVATKAQFLNSADSLLVRGTYIRCVLETRIITDIPGFTSCIVTEPVYSINGRRLLLPKGSKVSGKYDTEDPKIPRVSVIWDRITTPNGIDVSMASPGIDNLGGAGHPGQYNAHWGSKLSSALLISLVSDVFKYAGEKYGPPTETVTTGGQVITTPFQSNTAQTVERMANQMVERNLSRPATVTINQGTVVNIYVAKDVSFAGVVAR